MKTAQIFKAFLRRDWIERTSYRSAFVLEACGILGTLFVFYFISQLVTPENTTSAVEQYRYFPYVVVGLAFAGLQSTALFSFSNVLRNEQSQGTLETLILQGVSPALILIYGSIYQLLVQIIQIAFYLFCAAFFFHFKFGRVDIPALSLTCALTLLSLTGLGLFSAGFTLRHQRGNPIQAFLNSGFKILGGVFFPVTLLPAGMQWVAKCIPLTHALNALRAVLLDHVDMIQISPSILALLLFSLILNPLGWLYFKHSFQRTRQEGCLNFV